MSRRSFVAERLEIGGGDAADGGEPHRLRVKAGAFRECGGGAVGVKILAPEIDLVAGVELGRVEPGFGVGGRAEAGIGGAQAGQAAQGVAGRADAGALPALRRGAGDAGQQRAAGDARGLVGLDHAGGGGGHIRAAGGGEIDQPVEIGRTRSRATSRWRAAPRGA